MDTIKQYIYIILSVACATVIVNNKFVSDKAETILFVAFATNIFNKTGPLENILSVACATDAYSNIFNSVAVVSVTDTEASIFNSVIIVYFMTF